VVQFAVEEIVRRHGVARRVVAGDGVGPPHLLQTYRTSERGDGQGRIDKVAFRRASRSGFRSQVRCPCGLVLDDHELPQRREIFAGGVLLERALGSPGIRGERRGRDCHWWDFADLRSWPQVKAPLRVVRSLETYAVRRQLDRTITQETSDWVWVTTLPSQQAPTARIVAWGHQRWDIENFGFNELVNGWEADHIYKHDAKAIEAFLLMAFLAYNIFHAFIGLNLKPQLRNNKPEKYWACLIAAELYSDAGTIPKRAP